MKLNITKNSLLYLALTCLECSLTLYEQDDTLIANNLLISCSINFCLVKHDLNTPIEYRQVSAEIMSSNLLIPAFDNMQAKFCDVSGISVTWAKYIILYLESLASSQPRKSVDILNHSGNEYCEIDVKSIMSRIVFIIWRMRNVDISTSLSTI